MCSIAITVSDADIERCFPVMAELRPDLRREEFVERIRRQEAEGYKLLYLENGGEPKSVAGFRISENLAWGKFLYVDDLVTKSADNGKGYGGVLFAWLLQHAKAQGCDQLHLDSGVQRFAAHRFYLNRGMAITCHHFGMKLNNPARPVA
jgi:GNAT superfamily N-acetyltransferase